MSDRIRREDLTNATGNQDGYCDAGETCLAANTYLINAVEIVGDGVGDDDGLCESFEHCFYSPHFGAWQGEGSGAGAECVFDDDGGPVQGVRIFARTP